MDDMIPRRTFLASASVGAAGAAAAATLTPGITLAAETTGAAPAAAKTESAGAEFRVMHRIIEAAHKKLADDDWNYLTAAGGTGTTQMRNRQALDSLAIRPRMLRNVSNDTVDTSSQLLGQKIRMPVMLCGIGSPQKLHPGGAAEVARAAGEFGIPCGVGSLAMPSLEDTAKAGKGPKLYQLYVQGDDAWVDKMLQRAVDAGYTAVGFTLDNPVHSRREVVVETQGYHSDNSERPRDHGTNFSWDKLKRIRDRIKIPLFIKGITCGEDAEMACDIGCNAVWVSTHGGRQADHGVGSADILPEVVEAVHGRAQVIIDSGFSRGYDVAKALALGADCVGIGKLYLYGLAAGGAPGVLRVLDILEREFQEAMSFMGARRVGELNKKSIRTAMPVTQPGLFSAFPLLDLKKKA